MRTTLMRWVAALVLAAITVAPAAAQAVKPLTIAGQLKDTDPLDRLRKQSYHQVHEVELKKDQLYLIELRSLDFDTCLRVEDATGKPLTANDGIGPDFRNSRLGFLPSVAGKYRLVVTSFEGGRTGKYALHVMSLKPAGEAKTIKGKLTKDSPNVQGWYKQVHKVKVEAGRWYQLDLKSKEFDPFLILRDSQGKALAFDGDSGGDLNARLLWYSEKGGEWQIQASACQPGANGAYELRLRPYESAIVALTETEKMAQQARILFLRGFDLRRGGKATEALASLRQAVELYEKVFHKQDHRDLANSLHNLGSVLSDLGQPAKALPYHERALAMWERLYPKQDHPYLANSLNSLGIVLDTLGQLAKALPYYERALAMRERLYPKQDHPYLANSLNGLGLVLNNLGQPAKALPHLERALAMWERLYHKQDHPDRANGLNSLGSVLIALGQPTKALPHFERALAMWERLYPKQDHPELANSLNSLGIVLNDLGQPTKALPYAERALAMGERLYSKQDHPHLATSLDNLGAVLNALGQPAQALPHLERALAMRERLYPKQDHPELANSLNDLGIVQSTLGQPTKALPHLERALAMRERLYLKQDHPELANSLDGLGSVLIALGQPTKALPHLERALAMWERLSPKQDHPELANSLNSLGYVLNALGQPAKALPYYERALAMWKRLYPKQDHPRLADSLNSLGSVLGGLGQPAKGLPHLERALAMQERLYPKQDHPRLALNLHNLGSVLQYLGQPAKGLPHLERALTMRRNLGEEAYLGESQAMARAAALPTTQDFYLSVTRDLPSPASAYKLIWDTKAAVTRILQDRHAAARAGLSKSPEHKPLLDKLVMVRSQLTFLLLNPGPNAKERDKEIRQLTDRKAELERKLGEAFPEGPRRQKLAKLGPKDLLKRLSDRTAFIDFTRYTHVEKDKKPELRYVAFVLSKSGGIQRVELKEAEPIDLAVELWRQAVAGWSPSLKPQDQRELQDKADQQAAELRRLVWDPLAKHLPKDTNTVYLSLDGKLARFPFAALPGSKPGTILLQELAISTVPHGPALLERLFYPPQFAKGPGNALVVGGVTYDPTGGKAQNPWRDLKATALERDELKKLAGKRPLLSLSGLEATTDKLRQELPKARYAHLATHGFFLEEDFLEEKKRQSQQLKGFRFSMTGTTDLVGQGAQNPLGFAGLILSGANAPDKAGEDGGRLSGEGIMDLPLEGLRLAVLSACETGLGDKTGGEAVKNLQLAFHVAGCPHVLASLWQVDDRATAVFMAKFYHELWVKERPPLVALQQAQLMVYLRPDLVAELGGDDRGPPKVHADRRREVLEQGVNAPLAKGIQGKLPARTPTKLWAAFVLSGTGQ